MDVFAKFKKKLSDYGLEYFNKYYGVYRGSVFENEDPENQGRLRVKVPQIYGNKSPERWAYPRGSMAGKGHGLFLIPQKEDPIYISFENGDTRFPLWEYGWWLNGKAPKDTNVEKYTFISPSGHRIDLDDKNNAVEIKHKDGQELLMTDKDIYLGNSTMNLGKFFDELFTLIEATTTSTSLGPQPFINLAAWTLLKNKVKLFLKS